MGFPKNNTSTTPVVDYPNFDFISMPRWEPPKLDWKPPEFTPFKASTPELNFFNFDGGGTTQQNQGTDLLSMQSMFGGPNNMGWVTGGLGAATGLAQSWLGFQNLGLAKDQFNFQKEAYQNQFNMQKEEYDRRRSERDARIANANSAGL